MIQKSCVRLTQLFLIKRLTNAGILRIEFRSIFLNLNHALIRNDFTIVKLTRPYTSCYTRQPLL